MTKQSPSLRATGTDWSTNGEENVAGKNRSDDMTSEEEE